MMTAQELQAFEAEIALDFNAGKIRAPIHLDGGNEAALIDLFRKVGEEDWVCGSWRMHYKCLLKGVPPEELRAAILAGKSIALCFPQHRIVSSAIVGGILPIAVGIAWGIKRAGGTHRVWCFVGDMTSMTGGFMECVNYAERWDLPVRWVVEDNGVSVLTETRDVWNAPVLGCESEYSRPETVDYYRYDLPWPHSGAGTRVQF